MAQFSDNLKKLPGISHLAALNLLDAAGEMAGSLVILDVPDMAAAESWAKSDPYAMAGLFASVEIRPWKRVIG